MVQCPWEEAVLYLIWYGRKFEWNKEDYTRERSCYHIYWIALIYCFMYLSHDIIILQPKVRSGERSVVISLQDESMEYFSGHVIDGRNLFPATAYFVSFMKFLKEILFPSKYSFNCPNGIMLPSYIWYYSIFFWSTRIKLLLTVCVCRKYLLIIESSSLRGAFAFWPSPESYIVLKYLQFSPISHCCLIRYANETEISNGTARTPLLISSTLS
jgi:hypothetical protein